MTVKFLNNYGTNLAANITSTATTLTVSSGTGQTFLGLLTGGDVYYMTLIQVGTQAPFEIVQVTAVAGDTLTVVRAQDGTTARSWNLGDAVELRIPRVVLNLFTQTGVPLGTMATQNASAVAITGGTISGVTISGSTIPVSNITGTVLTSQGGTSLTSIGTANQILGVNAAANALEYKSITAGTGITITPTAGVLTIAASTASAGGVPTRQCILSAPVDANGFTTLGGSTGSTTITTTAVTSSAPLIATAAQGFNSSGQVDATGASTSNLSWTGLSTNGTMYLYVDISGGVLTPGATTSAPVYQFGGTPSITSGVFTFNISQMSNFLGNGSTAPIASRVFIGEVTVAGGVTTTLIWYAVRGIYKSAVTATLPTVSVFTVFNHNLGIPQQAIMQPAVLWFLNTTAEQGFSIGDVYRGWATANPFLIDPMTFTSRNTVGAQSGSTGTGWDLAQRTGGAANSITVANWSYYTTVNRGW